MRVRRRLRKRVGSHTAHRPPRILQAPAPVDGNCARLLIAGLTSDVGGAISSPDDEGGVTQGARFHV